MTSKIITFESGDIVCKSGSQTYPTIGLHRKNDLKAYPQRFVQDGELFTVVTSKQTAKAMCVLDELNQIFWVYKERMKKII